MQENNKVYYKKDFKEIFNRICTEFSGNSIFQSKSEQEKAIKEELGDNNSPENAMRIANKFEDWYQTNKINPLKEKMRGSYDQIVQGRNDGQRLVFEHARQKILGRLDELLPTRNVRGLNLIGTAHNNVQARIALSRQLSQEIQNSAGEEKDIKIQAFELVKGLQAFHETYTTSGEWVEYNNPLTGNGEAVRYREWVCYLYLANVFGAPEDILMPRNDLSEKDYRDRVFQSFIGALNDIIRGHNTDANNWPDRPFHPENAPSCIAGAKGRIMLRGAMYIRGLTFLDFEPAYNDPTSSIESSILTYVLKNLNTQRSKDLLQAIDNILMDPKGFELKPFFNLTDAQKNEIADGLARDMINDWTLNLSPSDKGKVIKEYKDQIKAAFIYKIDLSLTKYLREYLDINEVNGNFYDRLIEGAFQKIFDSPQSATQTFIEFEYISSIMRIYYQQKGIEPAITVLRELSNPENEVSRPVYLRFFKDLMVASGTESIAFLNQAEKNVLRNLLANPNEQAEVDLRNTLCDKFSWEEMSSRVLPQILGNNWKTLLFTQEYSPFLDALLKKYLSAKKYTDFCKMTSDLYTNNPDFMPTAYRNKTEVALKEALIKDLANPRPFLLHFLYGVQEPDALVERTIRKIIPELLEELKKSDEEQKQRNYVKLLTRMLIAGGAAPKTRENGLPVLSEADKGFLKRILLDPQEIEQADRGEILKEISWKDLSKALPSILGVNWKNQFVQSNALNMFLENVLKARRHNEFQEMIQNLGTKQNLDSKAEFTDKCVEKIPVVLEYELLGEPAKFDLLNLLLDDSQLQPKVISISNTQGITNFLKGLESAKIVKLLKNLERSSANLQKIRNRIKEDFSFEEINNLFNYFATERKIGSECVDFLTKWDDSIGEFNILKNEIKQCLNRMYDRAIQEPKDLITLKALMKVPEKQAAIKLLLNDKFNTFILNFNGNLTDEQKIAKTQAKEELVNLVSVVESINIPSVELPNFVNSIQNLFNNAYDRENWEACRLLLPIIKRHPEQYKLYSQEIMYISSRSPESKRELYNIAQKILGGVEENKTLFVKLLKKDDNLGTFVNYEGKYTDQRLEGLSHLVGALLNTIKYEGNDLATQVFYNSVHDDLKAFVEVQLTYLLNKSVSSQDQIIVPEITGCLIKDFGELFKNFPQNPNVAEKRYEAILKEAQMKMDLELKDLASKKPLEKLFNQFSAARDKFVNVQPVNEHYVPFSWSAKNSKELFLQVTTALKAIIEDENQNENVKKFTRILLDETKKLLGHKLSEKEAQVLYDSLSASYKCIKRCEDYKVISEDFCAHTMKELFQNMERFPWMKLMGYILLGLLALALLAAAVIVLIALLNPVLLGVATSAAILSTIGTVATQIAAFFTSIATAVSSFVATFGAATATTTVVAAAETMGAIVTTSVAGVSGLTATGLLTFFARRDVKDAESLERIKEYTQKIHEEIVGPRPGN